MTVRIGLVAASRIADPAVVVPARELDGVEVVAVAARSMDAARAAGDRWGIGLAFGDYAEMIASDEVDAVYIGTPAAMHREWSIRALDAGKHVLCEKPFASNANDARRLADAGNASGLVLMEALHWRFHPLVGQMQAVLDSGVLGDLVHLDAAFEVPAAAIPFDDIRWDLSIGGGVMMDIGIYPASWVRWAMADVVPAVTSAEATCPVPDVDGVMTAELLWPSGVTGSIRGSMMLDGPVSTSFLTVRGTKGSMHVDNPIAPQFGSSLAVVTAAGRAEQEVSTVTTYLCQLRAFRDAIVDGTPFPATADDAVATMELIDACYVASGLPPRPSRP